MIFWYQIGVFKFKEYQVMWGYWRYVVFDDVVGVGVM